MVWGLAGPLSLGASTCAANSFRSKSFFVLCHLKLRSGLSLRFIALLREFVTFVARRHVVGLILDPLNFEAGCYLLIKELFFFLLLEISEWIGLAYCVVLLHLLLSTLLKRVPLLLEFINQLFIHRL